MFSPKDSEFESRVRESFSPQTIMEAIGAWLASVSPGEVETRMPLRPGLSQQNGYVHAGIITAIVDSACGYAALSLTPAGCEVLTVEYKVNFLAPAAGDMFVARGKVARPGRTITVCSGDVLAEADGKERLVATMLTTMMVITPEPS